MNMSQIDTETTTWNKVMSAPLFVEGFKDAMTGVSFYEKHDKMSD